jgi:ferritin-like metal-binding protein YciE
MALDLKGYFAYQCFQLLKMEQDLRQLYDLLWKEVENFEIKELFRTRSESLRDQVQHLERALGKLTAGLPLPTGEAGRALEAAPEVLALMAEKGGHPLTQGLLQEHHAFMRLDPSQALIEIHHLQETERIEELETSAYDALLGLAQELRESALPELLRPDRTRQAEIRRLLQDRRRTVLREYHEADRREAA